MQQLRELEALYREWNAKINVISRKDIDNLFERHLLHGLLLGKLIRFNPGAEILDLGTGGGLPGLPLAILFPETRFTLIDGTGKKIKVVNEIVETIKLSNVRAEQRRAEDTRKKYDFVVSRAVARLDKLWQWSRPLIKSKHRHGQPNGLFALKGGDVQAEIRDLGKGEYTEVYRLYDLTRLPYYESKYIVYVQG